MEVTPGWVVESLGSRSMRLPPSLLFVAQSAPIRVFGIRLVGISLDTVRKLALTVALVGIVALARWLVQFVARRAGSANRGRVRFWTEQGFSLLLTALLIVGVISIWFDTTAQLTGALGLVAAGVAIALQRVITAFAAYLIILRGRVFTVGDRIVIGGVRGDVVALGFMQTTVMEMGEPPGTQGDAPGQWVHARQYS